MPKLEADDFVIGDLRDQAFCRSVIDTRFDEVYQLAADMGGAGYIFTGEHDADVMHNSATINLNVLDICYRRTIRTIFYSSSACMYPAYNQEDPDNPDARRTPPIRLRRTASTAGRSCSASGCISPIAATTACRRTSPVITTSSARKAPGRAGARRRPAAIVPQDRHGAQRR